MGDLISGAFRGVSTYNNAEQQLAVTAATHTINDANTDAANTLNAQKVASTNAMRLASNAIAAANAASQNQARSVGNQQRVQQVGAKADTLTQNLVRTAQGMVKGSVDDRIRSAEQLGAVTAQASAAGIGGGSVAAVRSALNIQASRSAQAITDKAKDQSYDGLVQRFGLQSAAYTTMDLNQSIAQINYAQDVFVPQVAPIVAADFAQDPTSQGQLAYFGGTDWAATGKQASDLFNSGSGNQGSYSTNGYNTNTSGGYQSNAVFSTGGGVGSNNYDYSTNGNFTSGSNEGGPSATYGYGGFSAVGSTSGSNNYGFTSDGGSSGGYGTSSSLFGGDGVGANDGI